MKLQCTTNPFLPATRQRHLVYLLIEVIPDPSEKPAAAALNLSLVVDASRSMSIPILTDVQFRDLAARGMAKQKLVDGVKVWQFEVPRGFRLDAPSNMEFTKQALRIAAARLRPRDRFSLVAFAQDALLMVSSTSGERSDALIDSISRLDQIDLGDETFMARGIQMGYRQALSGAGSDTVNRMVVLTDGYTKGERECYDWTRQARKDGIVVSTMGLGLDFNEELLISLADVSGGHAYFAEDPAEIPALFERELAGAQSVTWRQLDLVVEMPNEVLLRRAHSVRPALALASIEPLAGSSREGGTRVRVPLGDLEASHPDTGPGAAVLAELVVPPRPAGTYRLAQVTLDAVAGRKRAQLRQDVVVHYTEKASLLKQSEARLISVIQAVSAFKLQSQAMEELRRGNIAGATRRLRVAGERLVELGQEDLGHTMLAEAERMEEQGQMSPEGTKRLRYGTRRLS